MTIRALISLSALFFMLFAGAKPVAAQKKQNCFTGARLYELNPHETIADTAIFDLLAGYTDSLALKMKEVIVTNTAPLSKAQPECTMGNWIADAAKSCISRRFKKVDVCLLNYGCMGMDYIAPGPIYRRDFYELAPFENKMVLLSVSGIILAQLCDSIAHINGIPVSGLSFTIDSNTAKDIMVNGHPINAHLVYTLLVNDYIISRYYQLIGGISYLYTGLSLRNILLEESVLLQNNGIPVHSVLEKRITYAE